MMGPILPPQSDTLKKWFHHTRKASNLNRRLWSYVNCGESPPESLCVEFEKEVETINALRQAGGADEAAAWCKAAGLEHLEGILVQSDAYPSKAL